MADLTLFSHATSFFRNDYIFYFSSLLLQDTLQIRSPFSSDVCSSEVACFCSLSLMLAALRAVALFIFQAGTLLIVKVSTTDNYAGAPGINWD